MQVLVHLLALVTDMLILVEQGTEDPRVGFDKIG